MASVGIKAQIKQELRAYGIKEIKLTDGRHVRLANAKTTDLIATQRRLQTHQEVR